MPSDRSNRAYQQTTRAEQSEANTRRVIGSAVALLRTTRRIDEVTLDAIAAQSGVTVRTILRHFGTRDGLLEAAFLALGDEFSGHRIPPQPDNIDAAIQSLFENYEQDGDVNIRALEQEDDFPLVHEALQRGRANHRAWLEQLFAPHLAPLKPTARDQRVLQLYAVTDVYLWKLLRRDLGQATASAAHIIRSLIAAILNQK